MPLQAGDIIWVSVRGEPEITGQYHIRDDGTVIFPLLGQINVVGSTPTQLSDQLRKLADKFVTKPVVSVSLVAPAPRLVTVFGQVTRPGVYDLRQCPTLLALVAVAGNAATTGDLRQAVLLRKGEAIPVIPDHLAGRAIPNDIPLMAGDALYVPSRDLRGIYVMGAVKLPGPLSLNEAATAGRAIVMAGGPTVEGDAEAAYVMRRGGQLPVDLSPFTQASARTAVGSATDMPLEVGDVLMVPTRSDASVYVVGEVRTTGSVPYNKAPLASAAISLAGGLTENANSAEAYLLRQGQKKPLNLRGILQEGLAERDLALQPRDVLVVPRQSRIFHAVGQVAKPGPLNLDSANTVVAAWAQAGGPLPEADIHNVMLLRGTEVKRLDMEALIDRGDMQYNLALEPGDQLIVPRLLDQVYVLGQVARPGPYAIHQGDTLIDLLARAGGPTIAAQVEVVALVRRAPGAVLDATGAATALDDQTPPPATGGVLPARATLAPATQLQNRIDQGLNVRFLDLAKVQAGADVYLARHGDLIYVPAVKEKRRIDLIQVLVAMATTLLVK